jgi:tRNA (mo5U34)-methyltransferase
MRKQTSMSLEEVRSLIQTVYWYHTYEIVPGVVTPGICIATPEYTLNEAFHLEESLAGKRVLEIGTWDGPYAFELESRQAEVVATDIQDPAATGFNVSKRILGSEVDYVRTSVYDLEKNVTGQFDIILFLGVFYHLKYPLLAFEQIYKLLKPSGLLLFEGECFSHYAETLGNKRIWNRLRLALIAHSEIPLALSYPGKYKGSSNWFIPNVACLRSWLQSAGFEIQEIQTTFPRAEFRSGLKVKSLLDFTRSLRSLKGSSHQRAFGVARKLDIALEVEHGLMPSKS